MDNHCLQATRSWTSCTWRVGRGVPRRSMHGMCRVPARLVSAAPTHTACHHLLLLSPIERSLSPRLLVVHFGCVGPQALDHEAAGPADSVPGRNHEHEP
jgi:hypothetical protein